MRFGSHVRIQFQANSRFDLLHLKTRHRWLNLWQFLAYKLSRGFGIAMAIHGFCFAVHWHGDCEVVKHLSIQGLCNSSRNWQPLGPEYIPHQHYVIYHPLQMSCDWTLMFHLYTSGKTHQVWKAPELVQEAQCAGTLAPLWAASACHSSCHLLYISQRWKSFDFPKWAHNWHIDTCSRS